ncbi:MAG: hypothetical protein LBR75_04140 [Prevotellaceae bacterium]|jgi:hypothetical protein|nr:hypothetical protein [Prevotellaceae bacterium]
MKKTLFSVVLMVGAFAANAQNYLVNDSFLSKSKSSGSYSEPSFVMEGTAGITLNLASCDFEEIDEADKNGFSAAANDGKTGGQVNIRIGDNTRTPVGSASFTIPAGTSVGSIRLFLRAKGKTTNGAGTRTAIISIKEGALEQDIHYDGLGIDAGKEYLNVVNEVIAEDVTVSVRAAGEDPIVLCSVQVTEYGTAGLADIAAGNVVSARYFSLTGVEVPAATKGILIETLLYENGKTAVNKVFNK